MRDYKLKQRNLRASHTLGWSIIIFLNFNFFPFIFKKDNKKNLFPKNHSKCLQISHIMSAWGSKCLPTLSSVRFDRLTNVYFLPIRPLCPTLREERETEKSEIKSESERWCTFVGMSRVIVKQLFFSFSLSERWSTCAICMKRCANEKLIPFSFLLCFCAIPAGPNGYPISPIKVCIIQTDGQKTFQINAHFMRQYVGLCSTRGARGLAQGVHQHHWSGAC